jgi:acyl carrier protein
MDELQREIAESIVDALGLPDVRIDDLNTATPLYGEGMGLDSIDILEVALVVSKRYGFELRSDNPENEKIFRTLGSLAEHVRRHRTK